MRKLETNTINNVLVLGVLALMSYISVFGIYNSFGSNIVSMIMELPTIQDKFANFGILAIFAGTAIYLGSIYLKTKGFFETMKTMFIALASLVTIAGLMFLSSSVIYPLTSMAVIGIAMVLFKMMFNTIGHLGTFAVLGLLITIPVVAVKSSTSVDVSTVVTLVQAMLTVVVFVGATYPRLRTLLFKTNTVTGVMGSEDNNDSEGGNHET